MSNEELANELAGRVGALRDAHMPTTAAVVEEAAARLRQQSEDSARYNDTYLQLHHAITESSIGTARLYLQQGSPQMALTRLDKACDEIDAITIKYQPATAQLMGLCDGPNTTIDKARSNG